MDPHRLASPAVGLLIFAVGAVVTSTRCVPDAPPPAAAATPLFTPRWAFEPWISKDISDGPDTRAFLAGFQERDIPVGVIVLDSPWETNYNTFIPNEQRYPDFAGMVGDFKAQNVRTVLWVTQMVNESSFDIEAGGDTYQGPASNYIEAQEKNFLVNDGNVYLWWKGQGAAVDFFNADARDWWHAQQDALLDIGVAGWKLDFGEQYISELPIRTADGDKTLQEYSEAYYRDYWEHGATHVPGGTREFLTMVRPYDESYGFEPRFYARPENAPVAWVGDQFRDLAGFVDGLDHIFRSAQKGYVVVGSDIGGYLDNRVGMDIPFELDTFRRWTAASALMPFFQLHGRANLAPWAVPVDDPQAVDETAVQYRYWATLHHALVPYLFSVAREAQLAGIGRGRSVMTVVGDGPEAWADDWRFFSGPAFLVAALTTGAERDIVLPPTGDGARYLDWYAIDGPKLEAGSTQAFVASAQREVGLYVKEGAIIPMTIDSDALGLGDPAFASALTILAVPGPSPTTFTLHGEDDSTGLITLAPDGAVRLLGIPGRVIVRLRIDAGGVSVHVDGAPVPAVASLVDLATGPSGAFLDPTGRAAWVAVPDGADADISLH